MKIIPNDSDTSSDGQPPSPYSRRKPRKPRPMRMRSRSADDTATGIQMESIQSEKITKFDASVLLATPPNAKRNNVDRMSTSSTVKENVFNFDSAQNSPYSQRYPANRSVSH